MQWFPAKLEEIDDITTLPSAIAHDVYMHCSYDVASNKHYVKKALNSVLRKSILKNAWSDRDVSTIGEKTASP